MDLQVTGYENDMEKDVSLDIQMKLFDALKMKREL